MFGFVDSRTLLLLVASQLVLQPVVRCQQEDYRKFYFLLIQCINAVTVMVTVMMCFYLLYFQFCFLCHSQYKDTCCGLGFSCFSHLLFLEAKCVSSDSSSRSGVSNPVHYSSAKLSCVCRSSYGMFSFW